MHMCGVLTCWKRTMPVGINCSRKLFLGNYNEFALMAFKTLCMTRVTCTALMAVGGVLHTTGILAHSGKTVNNCMWIVHWWTTANTRIFVEAIIVRIIHLLLERIWIQICPIGDAVNLHKRSLLRLAHDWKQRPTLLVRVLAWARGKVLEGDDVTFRVIHRVRQYIVRGNLQ